MKKEISTPMMAAIVVVFVGLVAAIGWFMINRPAPPVPKTTAIGGAIPGGGTGTGSAANVEEVK